MPKVGKNATVCFYLQFGHINLFFPQQSPSITIDPIGFTLFQTMMSQMQKNKGFSKLLAP